MIDFIIEIIDSTLTALRDAQHYLLVIFFYAVTILHLPMDDVLEMFGILVLLTLGINLILADSGEHQP
ncbi:MAG TPA: hypothetical protein PLE99_06175 [Candidatus Thiothrix moscowensis]|uniref:hypothetical protein n=1 Tax=unclassified Thiothrix TaxID=2636184 RepID=UPI001A346928|nr:MULTISPECIES: hypothetical protein [unclassified Thiothrix]MBJ6611100.1 hypothetical protein [Candidatus Thiothrix moscowensis]HRJ52332.1 hypothetical protein [Candidatus Thiothrix moscowensis]HRJ92647.1 hypothetical protein [Candidatus Thiothrix moscowensis]